MTTLQQRMIEAMTVRGLVPSTQQAYLRAEGVSELWICYSLTEEERHQLA